jgi:outer membrane protein OmpA-like peptidoglycan-associated protein
MRPSLPWRIEGASVSAYPYRLQIAWVALLALTWLGLCSPWPWGWNVALGVSVAGTAIAAVSFAARRQRAQRDATMPTLAAIDSRLSELPLEVRRHTPLVLTVGDAHALTSVWGGDDRVHVNEAAIWVRCDVPTALPHLADALKRWREGQGPDAVACLVAADQGRGDTHPAAALKPWRAAIVTAGRAVGYPLPVAIAVYAETADRAPEPCPWFGISGAASLDAATLPELLAPGLQQYGRLSMLGLHQARARRAALLDGLACWASEGLLALERVGHVPLRIIAFGVTLVPGMPSPRAAFAQFLAQRTGLAGVPSDRVVLSRYPLPGELLRGARRQRVRRPLPRALVHALSALAVFGCFGAAASAWQNRALVQRIVDHVVRYQAIPAEHDAARVDALNAIRRDRDELARYAIAGVPPRLAFGLYRGRSWLPRLNTIIASYQPPSPPMTMIEVDSLALFRSGSAVLNPGSTRSLIGALDMIRAHTDKRVLVAGYTDSLGNTDTNLKLSLARAAAVRDWLVDASGLSPTHFAIQGYGDTRPKASNATEAGRAANRRVTITLIPDCHDRGSNQPTPQGLVACS